MVGRCFNCGGKYHVRKDCTSPPRCINCGSECHRQRDCPFPPLVAAPSRKRRRSPAVTAGHRRAAPQHGSTQRGRSPGSESDDTASARSVSTGWSTWVPQCCAPSPQMTDPVPPPPAHEAADTVMTEHSWEERRHTSLVVVPRSAELDLGRALVAVVAGTRPPVSPAMVHAYLATQFGIEGASVRRHDPEDFIVRFSSHEDMERVLHTRVHDPPFLVIWHPWRRTSMARFRVLVAMERVPPARAVGGHRADHPGTGMRPS